MKTSQNNNQVTIRRKNNNIAILLSILTLVWFVAFFLYALAFTDMLEDLYGTCIFAGTPVLMVCFLSLIIKQRYDDDKIIEQKDVQISVLLACYAKIYSDSQEITKLLDDLRNEIGCMDTTSPKDMKSAVEKTKSDLNKILSMDNQS